MTFQLRIQPEGRWAQFTSGTQEKTGLAHNCTQEWLGTIASTQHGVGRGCVQVQHEIGHGHVRIQYKDGRGCFHVQYRAGHSKPPLYSELGTTKDIIISRVITYARYLLNEIDLRNYDPSLSINNHHCHVIDMP